MLDFNIKEQDKLIVYQLLKKFLLIIPVAYSLFLFFLENLVFFLSWLLHDWRRDLVKNYSSHKWLKAQIWKLIFSP